MKKEKIEKLISDMDAILDKYEKDREKAIKCLRSGFAQIIRELEDEEKCVDVMDIKTTQTKFKIGDSVKPCQECAHYEVCYKWRKNGWIKGCENWRSKYVQNKKKHDLY